MNVEIIATVTRKGQVTIPREVRRRLGVDTPDKVAFVLDDEGVHLRPVPLTLEALFGSVPPLPDRETVDFEELIDEAMQEAANQIVQEIERQ